MARLNPHPEKYSSTNEDHLYSFNKLSPTEYYGLVTDTINPNNLDSITRKLELLTVPAGVLIAVAGSDGKLEQHAQSKTELIVIQEDSSLCGDVALQEFFGKEHYMQLFDTGPEGIIDTKNLNDSTPLSYAFGDEDTPYPDRTLNIFPIHPVSQASLDLLYRTRERTLIELSTNRRIRDKLKSQLRSYKRCMKTGEYRHVPIFDSESHTQFYSELWPAYSTGFKAAFLRAVQRKLDLLTIQLQGKKDWSEVAREIPTTTVGRLDYLAQYDIISPEDAVSTSEAYAWFLQQYHYVQENYKETSQPTQLSYDPTLFEEYRQNIETFSNL